MLQQVLAAVKILSSTGVVRYDKLLDLDVVLDWRESKTKRKADTPTQSSSTMANKKAKNGTLKASKVVPNGTAPVADANGK